jgi:hypothetical protein
MSDPKGGISDCQARIRVLGSKEFCQAAQSNSRR